MTVPRYRERGQALVIMAVALPVIILVVSMAIDGGNAFAEQRDTQNGGDAAATAGAIVLAERLACSNLTSTPCTTTLGQWDAQVASAVNANAAENDVEVAAAYYTDLQGLPLGVGSLPAGADIANLGGVSHVGGGFVPPTAAGVMVVGRSVAQTYFAQLIGLNEIVVQTVSSAVAGYAECEGCPVLPIAIPVNEVTCDGQNKSVFSPFTWGSNTLYKVPLCGSNPGSVGWVDWTPPNGGINEVVGYVNTPGNNDIPLPSWQYITSTGNPNSSTLQAALRERNGETVLLPMFDYTCGPQGNEPAPDAGQVETPALYGCPSLTAFGGGQGVNQWYRIKSMAVFELCHPDTCSGLHGAYVTGSNSVCESGNGATSCLVGKFTQVLSTGTIPAGGLSGSCDPGDLPYWSGCQVGVQLVR